MEAAPVDANMVVALREAIRECSDRHLIVASKWAADLLMSITPEKRKTGPAQSTDSQPSVFAAPVDFRHDTIAGHNRHPDAPTLQPLSEELRLREQELQALEADDVLAAKAAMDHKQYRRAISYLDKKKSAKAIYMARYSEFLVSEWKSAKDWYRLDGTRLQQPNHRNVVAGLLLQTMESDVERTRDPWLLFLKALLLYRLSRRDEAIECLLMSISTFPWNWSAWLLLGDCVGDGEELSSILPLLPLLPSHPLVQMWQIKTLNSLNSPSENELGLCDQLLREDMFPNSTWIMSQRACVLYHLHDFSQAEAQFKKILSIDNSRVDDIDVYSNILYVTENRLELSRLAHDRIIHDKDRPEVCCLIGNYYSLRSQHDKAIKYFKRATQLDRTYLSAWTLMGHEYVEMKNAHAAIEAYRKAVDVNRKDYRAWYGLGQAYELLGMHEYALYYYQHATSLRPYDVRIWQAQGMCYQEMSRYREAIECLKRALIGADPFETAIRLRMALIHTALGEIQEAVACHNHIVETYASDNRPINEYAGSCIEVARFQLSRNLDLELGKALMERVAASNSEHVAQAAELLKKIQVAMNMRTHQTTAGSLAGGGGGVPGAVGGGDGSTGGGAPNH